MKFERRYILYIYVSQTDIKEVKMAVISIYDINAKANAIQRELIKDSSPADKSEVLYGEMQTFAETNLNIIRYMRK